MHRTVYYNVHVPKNGGSTFNWILARYLGSAYKYLPYDMAGYVMSDEEKKEIVENNPNVSCFSGHALRYPGPDVAGAEYRYITFLREPIERLVSLYAYERKTSNSDHCSYKSFPEWVDKRLQEDNALTNYQAFHIVGASDPNNVELSDVKAMLDKFYFVGIVEKFDESLLLLGRKMGMSVYDCYYEKQNVTGSNSKYKIDNAMRQMLIDLNRIDVELYEYARKRIESEILQNEKYMNRNLEKLRSLNSKGMTAAIRLHFAKRSLMRHLGIQNIP